MRSRKAIINTIAGLSYEAVALICGLILPRLILSSFGSSYNGITSSISQFLSCISLLRSGISGVTKAALYKPLAEHDTTKISQVLRATEIFMRKVAMIFIVFLVLFACIYPFVVKDEFSWAFSSSLVLILGIGTFAQYYWGYTYQILLNADQRQCVTSFVQIFTTILNTVVAALLIYAGAGIHVVKLGSALAFALNPIIINLYAHRKYRLIPDVEPDNQAVSQRWDAFAHQVANFVNTNTDIMLLTFFTDMKEVSVYSVYYLVINGLDRLLRNSIPGVAAAFGDMLARGEHELAKKNFDIFELVIFSLATVLEVTAGIMITSFVLLYTKGITDVSYSRPIFGTIAVTAAFFACVRIPYQHVVEAAGHFKQTKKGAFAEAIMNISISVICVFRFGLVGVTVGTLVAAVFRTVQYSLYLAKNIIHRSYFQCFKHVLASFVIAVITVSVYQALPLPECSNYMLWVVNAVAVFVIVVVLVIASDFLLFRKETIGLLSKLQGIVLSGKSGSTKNM